MVAEPLDCIVCFCHQKQKTWKDIWLIAFHFYSHGFSFCRFITIFVCMELRRTDRVNLRSHHEWKYFVPSTHLYQVLEWKLGFRKCFTSDCSLSHPVQTFWNNVSDQNIQLSWLLLVSFPTSFPLLENKATCHSSWNPLFLTHSNI